MSCINKIEIFRGDTPKFMFEIMDSDECPLDISTANVYFVAKTTVSDSGFIFDRTCTITEGTKGECEVRLTETDTNIIVKNGLAELSVEFPSENVILTVEQFPIEIKADVRR